MLNPRNLPNPDQIHEHHDLEGGEYRLSLGGKTLTVGQPTYGYPESVTVVRNDGAPSVPGATTVLYLRAMELMQAEADRLGVPVTYTYSTSDPSMVAWAQNGGSELLEMEPHHPNPEDGISYYRVFEPIDPTN